jgi:hypothetical protein
MVTISVTERMIHIRISKNTAMPWLSITMMLMDDYLIYKS